MKPQKFLLQIWFNIFTSYNYYVLTKGFIQVFNIITIYNAPEVMFHIYFHGNNNGYCEHNNTVI